jgi:hypothetical protein
MSDGPSEDGILQWDVKRTWQEVANYCHRRAGLFAFPQMDRKYGTFFRRTLHLYDETVACAAHSQPPVYELVSEC